MRRPSKENKALENNIPKEDVPRTQKLVASMLLEDRHVLQTDQIQLGNLVGSGGFAKVFACQLDGQPAVCKMIPAEKINDEMTYLLTNECTIWSKLAHRNIVSFYGMASASESVWLVCEWMPDGSLLELHQKLRKAKAPPPSDLGLLTKLSQVADGMSYLHAMEPPVLHRDLKSANILLSEGVERLAIADFGLARYCAGHGNKMTAETGSYRWMAPEVIRHEQYDERCDVYSFAILSWEMITYRIPFDQLMPVEAAFAVAKEGSRPSIPSYFTNQSITDMIGACWAQEPHQRPSFAKLSKALKEGVALHEKAKAA